jgi:hypothetical protein
MPWHQHQRLQVGGNQGAIATDAAPVGAARAPSGAGLVSFGTTDTLLIEDDPLRRIKRMKRGVFHSARLIDSGLIEEQARYKALFVTLTYSDDWDWRPDQISRYLKVCREWARRRGFTLRYVWVLELTKRGRPHYHVVFWVPRSLTMPKADKRGWWRCGFTKTERARNPVGYLVKYASKGASKDSDMPHGARLWGCGGLTRSQSRERSVLMAPAWLRALVPVAEGVRRKGGWWFNCATGWGYKSPWDVRLRGDGKLALVWWGWSERNIFIPH